MTILSNKLITISVLIYVFKLCSTQIISPLFTRDDELEQIVTDIVKSTPGLQNVITQFVESDFLDQYKLADENNDEKDLSITQLAAKYGYNLETYHVQTEDGYINAVYRIPSTGDPVLLVHTLFNSAVDWFTVGRNALPYLLADQGYDVWVLTARGSTDASRGHVNFTAETDPARYYDFSFDEIGRYDVPATIDFVLKSTGKSTLRYVGHSQGNTAFWVMASERPEYNDKVSIAVALAPVIKFTHSISPLRALVVLGDSESLVRDYLGLNVVKLDNNPFVEIVTKVLCGNSVVATLLCSNIEFALAGFDYGQVNVTQMPVIFGHTPSSVSTKLIFHYLQGIQSDKFRRYDYRLDNEKVYGSLEPPEYPLEKISTPVALFYRNNSDWISTYEDLIPLKERLQNIVDFYEVPYDQWNLYDYVYGKDVKTLVYDRILELFKKY